MLPAEELLELDHKYRKHGARLTIVSAITLMLCGAAFYQILIDTNVVKHPYRWAWPSCHAFGEMLCRPDDSLTSPSPLKTPSNREFTYRYSPRTSSGKTQSKGHSNKSSHVKTSPTATATPGSGGKQSPPKHIPGVPGGTNPPGAEKPLVDTKDIQNTATKTINTATRSIPTSPPKVNIPDIPKVKSPKVDIPAKVKIPKVDVPTRTTAASKDGSKKSDKSDKDKKEDKGSDEPTKDLLGSLHK